MNKSFARAATALLGASALLMFSKAQAQGMPEASPYWQNAGVTVEAGTAGAGVHFSLALHERLNARVGLNYLTYDFTGDTADAEYDFDMKLQTFDFLLDWFPMKSQWRISAGVVLNGNEIKVVAKPAANGSYQFQGNTYDGARAGKIDGNVAFKKVVPYLGVGWGNAVAVNKGWGFSSDLGVLFQGTPETTLLNTGCSAPAAMCAGLAAAVAKESVKLNGEVKDFKFYPVIRLGVSYKF